MSSRRRRRRKRRNRSNRRRRKRGVSWRWSLLRTRGRNGALKMRNVTKMGDTSFGF